MRYILATALFLAVLTGCKPGLPDLQEACNVLNAAGVNKNFRLTVEEATALSRDHRVILNNIKKWYRENCA